MSIQQTEISFSSMIKNLKYMEKKIMDYMQKRMTPFIRINLFTTM